MSSVKALLVAALAANSCDAMRRKVPESIDFNGLWSKDVPSSAESQIKQANASLAKKVKDVAASSNSSAAALVANQSSLVENRSAAAPLVAAVVNTSLAAKGSNLSLAKVVAAPPAPPCTTLLWNLVMQSKHSSGWQGARLVVSSCDGAVLHNKTLEGSGLVQHALCLPVLFDVEVAHTGGKVEDVQWNLTAEGVRNFVGSAPFRGGFCASDPLPAVQEAALEEEYPPYHPSAWSQWWSQLHQKAKDHMKMSEQEQKQMAELLSQQTFRFIRAGRVG